MAARGDAAALGLPRPAGDDDGGPLPRAYRARRYSFGYPACPDLEDQAALFDLLRPRRSASS